MIRMSSWACRFLALVLSVFALSPLAIPPSHTADVVPARMMADGGPIAVISPLPDYVSNGTWQTLDASGSIGTITRYEWNVTFGGVSDIDEAKSQTYLFLYPGLYKITLTVTDNQSRTSTEFTAVVSVLDSDQDSLPDWWEEKYFGDLSQTAKGDYDHDGYDNLEEYAQGTNPTVKDPRPTFVEMLKDNWIYVAILAAVIVGAVLALMPILRKKRKVQEKKKIAAAIAIEKALESDEK